MIVRRNLVRGMIVGTIASACIGLAAPMAFAAPANAATAGISASQSSSTDELKSHVDKTLKKWKWIQGGGSCSATSDVYYDPSSGLVTVDSRAYSGNAFRGCSARTHLMLYTGAGPLYISRDIPTACGAADASCSNDPAPGEPGRGRAWDIYTTYADGWVIGVSDHVIESR
jgi:hypothetical protein